MYEARSMAIIRFGQKLIKLNQLLLTRSITTSSPIMEKVMEDLRGNPYYEKYASRIAALQKTSPEEFMKRIEQKQEEDINSQKKRLEESTKQYAPLMNPKQNLTEEAVMSNKQLSDLLKIELVKDKQPKEISEIWQTYHKDKDVITATIPNDVYGKLKETQKKYPTFLFPLPRNQGYEFIMSQISGNSVHFTPLICYQVHKENAPECLTMVHYTELEEEKGIVLMRGDFDTDVLNAHEAQCLANQFQLYYGQQHPSKTVMLETFSNKPDSFKHSDLIAELENVSVY